MRIHLHGAKVALAAAEAGDPNSLETALNYGTARIHAIAALRMLSPEAREQIFAKDAPE